MSQTFGERIRELRQAADLSLREFAKRLATDGNPPTAPYLSDIELGRRYPSTKLMARIAHVLGVELDELKALDPRPPIDALKRLGEQDPKLAVALRRVVDEGVSGEDLDEFLKKLKGKKR